MSGLILKHPVISKVLLTEARSIHGITQKYFIHDKSIFLTATAVRTFVTRCTRLSDGVTRPANFLKSNGLLRSLLAQRRQMSQLDVSTNVQNNVILYKYERSSYFRNIRIFGIGQLFGWLILAVYTYKPSFWDIFSTDIKFKEYLFNHMIRLPLFLFSFVAGPLMFLFVYATCARSVKYIILNKGGKTLSITTYQMQKKKSSINIPIGMAKCTSHRTEEGLHVSLKVKNKSLYYLVDKSGTFVNPKLFDHVMG